MGSDPGVRSKGQTPGSGKTAGELIVSFGIGPDHVRNQRLFHPGSNVRRSRFIDRDGVRPPLIHQEGKIPDYVLFLATKAKLRTTGR